MNSIVLDLQKDALNNTIQISDLLRKALFVAKKLDVKEFEKWVSEELSGYKEVDDIPEYRLLPGRVKAWNQFHGWVPVLFEDPSHSRLASERHIGQSIAALEELIEGDSSLLLVPFPSDFAYEIAKSTGNQPTEIVLQIERSGIRTILDTVRTIILNWGIQLEKDGILGEGLAFSERERTSASKSTYNINNFYGPVEQSNFQQGVKRGIQTKHFSEINLEKLSNFLNILAKSIPDLDLPTDIQTETNSDIESIKSQIDSPNPKSSIIQTGLSSIKRILEKVTSQIGTELLMKVGEFFNN